MLICPGLMQYVNAQTCSGGNAAYPVVVGCRRARDRHIGQWSAEGHSALLVKPRCSHANDRPATRAGWRARIAAGATSGLRIRAFGGQGPG